MMFTSAYNTIVKSSRCWNFLKIATSLGMFIMLFIFLSNPASCINNNICTTKLFVHRQDVLSTKDTTYKSPKYVLSTEDST